MIKTDYEFSSVKVSDLKKYEDKLNEVVIKFENRECLGEDFIGWYEYPNNISDQLIQKIMDDADKIKKNSDVFVVCGIGGSYLGPYFYFSTTSVKPSLYKQTK